MANTQMERCPSCEIVELNQERLVSAVMLALHDVSLRCSTDAAVIWFQQAYSEAIKTLRSADEAEVFKVRKGKPTLTGHSTPAAPETPPDSFMQDLMDHALEPDFSLDSDQKRTRKVKGEA